MSMVSSGLTFGSSVTQELRVLPGREPGFCLAGNSVSSSLVSPTHPEDLDGKEDAVEVKESGEDQIAAEEIEEQEVRVVKRPHDRQARSEGNWGAPSNALAIPILV